MNNIKNDLTNWGPEADKLNENFNLIDKLLPIVVSYTSSITDTRLLVVEENRFDGKILAYKINDEYTIEQYKGTSFLDVDWVDDSNWQKISTSYFINLLTKLSYSHNIYVNINDSTEDVLYSGSKHDIIKIPLENVSKLIIKHLNNPTNILIFDSNMLNITEIFQSEVIDDSKVYLKLFDIPLTTNLFIKIL